ncbi:MAG: biotin/lipoyl-containing protein, partial [Bacteroidota bacterium]
WAFGEDDEELMELAMHPEQYRNYKSGKAKADFLADLEKRKAAANPAPKAPVPSSAAVHYQPKTMQIDVNGQSYTVKVAYDDEGKTAPTPASNGQSQGTASPSSHANGSSNGQGEGIAVLAPLEGTFYLTKSPGEKGVQAGDMVKKGDVVGYIESMKVYNAITAEVDGKVLEICRNNSETVEEDDVLIKLQ